MTIDLETLHLDKGSHKSVDDGLCIMEAVAYFAHEAHTDFPVCASPVLGAFLRNWNDSVDGDFRQKLKPFIPRLIGTAKDGKDETRAWMATDWLVRVCAPAWLDLAKLTEHAMALRAANQIISIATTERIQPQLVAAWAAARDAARAAAGAANQIISIATTERIQPQLAAAGAAARAAAGAAAGDAAGDAARAAAGAAARAAAGAAARAAAGAAAGDAAGAAARAAAGATARDAARDAARAAAGDAAGDAAGAAARAAARAAAGATARDAARDAARAAAGDAAGAAAGAALQPTVGLLQAAALELLDRMIDCKGKI